MNSISISTDRKIFDQGSAVRARMIEYGSFFDELHIIVFTKKYLGHEAWRIADNVWIYPTNSLGKVLYIHGAIRQAKKIITLRKCNPTNTVITTQDPFETGKVGLKLKQKYHFPLQVQVHTDLYSPYFAKESFLNRIRLGWAKAVLPRADTIRVVSERIKKSLIDRLGIASDRIDVLPIYTPKEIIDTEPTFDILKKYPQFTLAIVMVSRLTREKNLPFALNVFKEVLAQYPKTGLIFVGDGPEESSLRLQAQKLGIENSVIFEHWQNDLVPYYKTAQVFLHTSLYEGYGLVLVEAGLSEAAIVTSDVGIAGSILVDGKNAFVCPIGDTNCFVSKILQLITDNSTRTIFQKSVKNDVLASLITDKVQYLHQYRSLLEKAMHANSVSPS